MLKILQSKPAEKVMIDLEHLPHNLVALRITGSLKEMAKAYDNKMEELNEAHVLAAVQQAWRMSEATAQNAEYILAVVKEDIPGDKEHYTCRVIGVFKPLDYGFFTLGEPESSKSVRRCFLGQPAEPEISAMYLNRYLPDIVKVDSQPIRVYNKAKD